MSAANQFRPAWPRKALVGALLLLAGYGVGNIAAKLATWAGLAG